MRYCEVSEGPSSDGFTRLDLKCGEDYIGFMEVSRGKALGKKALIVDAVFIDEPNRRQGHATHLYEAAAEMACERQLPLASTSREEGAFSHDFWRKQLRKGRAVRNGETFVLNESCGADLSAFALPRKWPWLAGAVGLGALLLMGSSSVGGGSSLPPYAVPAARKKYGPILDAAGASYGVPAAMMRAVAWIESRWNPTAGSQVGAVGLMQLMPKVGESLGVTDRTDPTQNARGGAKFLASLYKKAGNWPVALAAYNWGPGNVFGASDKPPRMYSSQWPANTQQYVREVMEAFERGVA